MTGVCWSLVCDSTDTRRYLNGPACPEHTPARFAGHPEPGRTADGSWIAGSRRTSTWAKGGTDINKERPGGYVSRQRAVKIAAERDAIRNAS